MNDTSDPFDLERFVAAQRGVYETALAEIRAAFGDAMIARM